MQSQPLWSYASATQYVGVSYHFARSANDEVKAKGMLRLDQAEAVIVRLSYRLSVEHLP